MAQAPRRPVFPFLTRTTLALIAFAIFAAAFGNGQSNVYADLVVKNANVITVSRTQPRAQAFAVLNGHFVGVGNTASVARFIGP